MMVDGSVLEYVITALLGVLAFLGTSLWWGQRDVSKELRTVATALALLSQRLDGHIEGQSEWRASTERRLVGLEERSRGPA